MARDKGILELLDLHDETVKRVLKSLKTKGVEPSSSGYVAIERNGTHLLLYPLKDLLTALKNGGKNPEINFSPERATTVLEGYRIGDAKYVENRKALYIGIEKLGVVYMDGPEKFSWIPHISKISRDPQVWQFLELSGRLYAVIEDYPRRRSMIVEVDEHRIVPQVRIPSMKEGKEGFIEPLWVTADPAGDTYLYYAIPSPLEHKNTETMIEGFDLEKGLLTGKEVYWKKCATSLILLQAEFEGDCLLLPECAQRFQAVNLHTGESKTLIEVDGYTEFRRFIVLSGNELELKDAAYLVLLGEATSHNARLYFIETDERFNPLRKGAMIFPENTYYVMPLTFLRQEQYRNVVGE